ncbi:MAG: hypothetical protein IJA63_10565, partial [Akkermansia sp.]|nr:hypothetical protein [Akkermansia sp.]
HAGEGLIAVLSPAPPILLAPLSLSVFDEKKCLWGASGVVALVFTIFREIFRMIASSFCAG